jgi:hypothetical protein
VAARSKAWVYGRSLTGIVGSNPKKSRNVAKEIKTHISCEIHFLCENRAVYETITRDAVR